MNIRPMDLQVLIPRATDAAKTAIQTDRQAVTAQQQIAEQSKQTANEKQYQVQTALPGNASGKVSTEDLNQEKRQEHPAQGEQDEKHGKGGQSDEDAARKKHAETPPDPIRGHKIDIKT